MLKKSLFSLVLLVFTFNTAYGDNSAFNPIPGAAVTSITNADGTLAFSPTVGAAVGSLVTSKANAWTGQQNFTIATLTDASPITWNLNTQQVAKVLLTSGIGATRQLQNPTNMVAGGTYIIIITQSATGSNAVTYGTAYKWPGGVAPVLSTANNAVDILTFISDGTNMYGVSQKAFS